MSNVSVSPSFTPSDSAMPSSSDMPGFVRARLRRPERSRSTTRLPLGSVVGVHERLNSRSASRRARVSSYFARVERLAVHFDEPAAHHRPERRRRRRRSRSSCARASSTCSGSTLTRNWFGASGGRLARQLRIRSPRTTVSSSSAMRPSASAPICRLDANARRRRLARPKRHVMPRCGSRFSSEDQRPRATARRRRASPPTPPTMIEPACTSRAC